MQVLTTSSVLLTFPSQYTSISSVTCLSISVDSIAISSFSCSITGNTVRFDGVFTGVSNLYVGIVQLMVGNIKNPSPAIYTGTFTGYIGSDYAVPVSTGVQLSPGKSIIIKDISQDAQSLLHQAKSSTPIQ